MCGGHFAASLVSPALAGCRALWALPSAKDALAPAEGGSPPKAAAKPAKGKAKGKGGKGKK